MSPPQWTETTCPPALSTLPTSIRGLALVYANAELVAGRHPERALSFGIAKAFGIDEEELGADATALCVRSADGQWTIFSDTAKEGYTFDSYEDALRRASELARSHGLPLLVLAEDGGILEKWEVSPDGKTDQALHVQPGSDGWVVRGPNGLDEYPTKAAGLAAARKEAEKLHADLVVHYQDGTVQSRRQYV